MKRSLSCVSENTRSKRPRLYGPLEYKRQKREIISATHLYHYMMKDPLVDWLKLNTRRGISSFQDYTQTRNSFKEFIKTPF